MGITIGIDIGGSTTKIIGVEDNKIKDPLLVRANDPIASLFGAFGKFVDNNNLSLGEVERVMVTGVGSSHMTKPLYGLPTAKVEEFLANGLGGLHLTALDEAIIVSMGTGTAIIKATKQSIEHIGGTGVGGGTLIGLSSRMLNIRDIQLILKTAEDGDLANIDLMVGDISRDVLPGLPPETTASNFGKISDVATKGDIALGILNLVFQTIGTISGFAAKNSGIKDIVLIGNLSTIPYCASIFSRLEEIYSVRFIIPDYSEYGTALGAALAYTHSRSYKDL